MPPRSENVPFDSQLGAAEGAPEVPQPLTEPLAGRFVLVRKLGEGGFGLVYEAVDRRGGERVALKLLRPGSPSWQTRFKREFRVLQGIAHPNWVALNELISDGGHWFFTMELLEGADFVTRVRLSPERLRDCLRQVFEGLGALHAAGKVHRDVKPSNVLVTRDGRVVLLDLGLVSDVTADDHPTESGMVGTPAYMAPEQVGGGAVGSAADMYSVGVMLYEALVGRVPIAGAPFQMLADKRKRVPIAPAFLVDGVSEDMNALCMSLLRVDPASRPSAMEAAAQLSPPPAASADGAPASSRAASVDRAPSSDAGAFVGRERELGGLWEAFESACRGVPSTVVVLGESGIGKSATVRQFAERVARDRPDALVLTGRCYERETIPYKTFDGVIDALSRWLGRMPAPARGAFLPTRVGELARLFPAMVRVSEEAMPEHAAALATVATVEPQELRRRAFVALRDLFTRVALRQPTVVVVDDLHWADDDGLLALSEVLRPPDPAPLLFIGTLRKNAPSTPAILDRLRRDAGSEVRPMELASLDPAEARTLATSLLRSARAAGVDPARIADEAHGHPLFVEELVRHAALGEAAGDIHLDEAIWARVEKLEGAMRTMIELAALAARPLPREVITRAAQLAPGAFGRSAAVLRAANLVRIGDVDAVEPYHDRVREAVAARLMPERRKSLHESLALAFEASNGDPEALAGHWRSAGNDGRAAAHAARAGEQAFSAFAFDRAARWFADALALTPAGRPERRDLGIRLGEALASAGRGSGAAAEFERAAADASPDDALDLRRRAAELLLRSGDFDRGLEASRVALAAVGVRMPSGTFATICALLYYRIRLMMAGPRFRSRSESEIPAATLRRIDTCWAIGSALLFVETFVGQALVMRALLFGLAAGEIHRIARCAGVKVSVSAVRGERAWKHTQAVIDRARALAERCATPDAEWYVVASEGTAMYLAGRFGPSVKHLRRALEISSDLSTGLVWEHVSTRRSLLESLSLLGKYKDLKRVQQEGLRDAEARAHVWGTVAMRVAEGNMAWLMEDRPDVAEAHVEAALGEWSKRTYHIEHHGGLIARINIRLYRGDIEGAYALACEVVSRDRRSFLWHIQIARLYVLRLRASAALAMIDRGLGDRRRLLSSIRRDARVLARSGIGWARGVAAMLRAGVAIHTGARDAGLQEIDRAAEEFEGAETMAYAAAVRDRAARLRGGGDDHPEVKRAAAFFRDEQVAVPARFVAMLVPGFDVACGAAPSALATAVEADRSPVSPVV